MSDAYDANIEDRFSRPLSLQNQQSPERSHPTKTRRRAHQTADVFILWAWVSVLKIEINEFVVLSFVVTG